jgi:putative ABC transport system permease protein
MPLSTGPADLKALLAIPGVEAAFQYGTGTGFFDAQSRERESLHEVSVSSGFFQTVGVRPVFGRELSSEDANSEPRRVLVSYGIWNERLGRDPGVAGRLVSLAGRRVEVAGVMPRGFNFPDGANVWIPPNPRIWIRAFVSVVRTQTPLSVRQFETAADRFVGVPLQSFLEPESKRARAVGFLFVAASAIVIITWLHVGMLRAVHVIDKMGDHAIRLALGARRGTLVREQCVQSAMLALLAIGIAAVVLPQALKVLISFLPPEVVLGRDIEVDYRSLLFLGGLTLLGTVGMTLAPIRASTRIDVLAGLKNSAPTASRRSSGRQLLVILQIGLVTALLYLTGLATHELVRLRTLNLGFETERLLVASLPDAPTSQVFGIWQSESLTRIKRLPGITMAAGGASPLAKSLQPVSVTAEAPSQAQLRQSPINALRRYVSPGFFQTMAIPFDEGRDFDWNTDRQTDNVIVSRSLAASFGPIPGAIGRSVFINGGRATVIGVVGDVRRGGTDTREQPSIYQLSVSHTLVVRSTGPVNQSLLTRVSDEIRAVTGRSDVDIRDAHTEVVTLLAPQQARASLMAFEGAAALALSLIALYGVSREMAHRQRHRAAICKALGATNTTIVIQMARPLVVVTAVGVTAGLIVGSASGAWLTSTAVVDSNGDPVAAATATAVVVLAVTAALIGPLRSAASVSPSVLLRSP